MVIYVLQQGVHDYRNNVMVTTDVKEVAKRYVEIVKNGSFGDLFESPCIEIWRNSEGYPIEFYENTTNEKQLVKYLSKLGRGIE